jgi:type II secretory pathway component PulK
MRDRAGFALVATLWLLVALGAVGLEAALHSRERRLAAANALDHTRARAAAIAGTEYARSRLTSAMLGEAERLRAEGIASARTERQRERAARRGGRDLFRSLDPLEDPWRAPQDLVAPEMAFGDARYALLLRDVGAALDLNGSDEPTLRQFFAQGLGLDYALSDRITQAILDWRDLDDLPRVNGGEREEYLDEGKLVLPPNRPFVDIDELRNVLHVTPEVFALAAPYLTLLIFEGSVNLNSAPEPVLLAIPGMTPALARELVRLREAGQLPRNDAHLTMLIPGMSRVIATVGRRFRDQTTYTTDQVEVLAEGWVDGGLVRVRSRVVVIRGGDQASVIWKEIF